MSLRHWLPLLVIFLAFGSLAFLVGFATSRVLLKERRNCPFPTGECVICFPRGNVSAHAHYSLGISL